MPINKSMMRNMVKEYGKRKAPKVYNALENKVIKQAPKKAERMFNVKPPVKKAAPLRERAKTMLGKVAKAMPKPIMNKLKNAMPAKLKDIKAKLKR